MRLRAAIKRKSRSNLGGPGRKEFCHGGGDVAERVFMRPQAGGNWPLANGELEQFCGGPEHKLF